MRTGSLAQTIGVATTDGFGGGAGIIWIGAKVDEACGKSTAVVGPATDATKFPIGLTNVCCC